MSIVRMAAASALVVALAWPAAAQGIPRVQSPEEVGFLSTRLKRLSDRLNEGVKNNELPGAVVLIARNGKLVMFESFGFRDKDAKVAMTNDTIFRIASMTKPIVTLAAMMLMEEGKLTLRRPRVDVHTGLRRHQGRRPDEKRTTARPRRCWSHSSGR